MVAYMSGTWQLPLSIYLFCVKTVMVAQTTTPCLSCPAASRTWRMLLSQYVLCILSPGQLIKKVGRDVMDGDFVYVVLFFNCLWGLFYCA